MPGGVHTRDLKLDGNDNLTCVQMSQDLFDSLWMYFGPNPCAVSSAPCFCIDFKNVAVVS